jgi:peptide/nickel transport system permease protein
LPGIVLSLLYVAGWSRYMRSSMLSVIRREFMLTARGKGVREHDIVWYHGLKNALIPVISVMALDLAGLFSGAVITETVFAWPGIGRLFIQSVYARDYPLVMGILMMGSFMVVFFNLIADIVYARLDPRITYS